jgi:hypothetical protein
MLRYFVAGNLWLIVALVMYIGRVTEHSDPVGMSLFGIGQAFQPHEYWAVIAMPTAASLLYFVMYAASGKNNDS